MVIPLVCRDGHIPSFEGNHLARVGRLVERELSLDAWFVYGVFLSCLYFLGHRRDLRDQWFDFVS